jgi:hypothetical protein
MTTIEDTMPSLAINRPPVALTAVWVAIAGLVVLAVASTARVSVPLVSKVFSIRSDQSQLEEENQPA